MPKENALQSSIFTCPTEVCLRKAIRYWRIYCRFVHDQVENTDELFYRTEISNCFINFLFVRKRTTNFVPDIFRFKFRESNCKIEFNFQVWHVCWSVGKCIKLFFFYLDDFSYRRTKLYKNFAFFLFPKKNLLKIILFSLITSS